MLHFRYFDMQHDYFQKKMLCHLNPTPGTDGVCKDIICNCMVLYAPFPLICYATLQLCKDRICACVVLYASFPLI